MARSSTSTEKRAAGKTVAKPETSRKKPVDVTAAIKDEAESDYGSIPATPKNGTPNASDPEPAEFAHATAKSKGKKRKIEEVESSSSAKQDPATASISAHRGSNSASSKKPRRGKAPTSQNEGKAKAMPRHGKTMYLKESVHGEPHYVVTDDPVGELISNVQIHQYSEVKTFKISADVVVKPSPFKKGKATVKSYNLTQMNRDFIKTLIQKLEHVAHIVASCRKWKLTLVFALGDANFPDKGDEPILKRFAEVQNDLKKGKLLEEEAAPMLKTIWDDEYCKWEPKWRTEPLYEMDIIRNMYEDPNINVLVLRTTHGECFIRTKNGHKPWDSFVEWIDVSQKNMHGYTPRERGGGKIWNGFGISEAPLTAHEDPNYEKTLAETETLFQEHKCATIWRTVCHLEIEAGQRMTS